MTSARKNTFLSTACVHIVVRLFKAINILIACCVIFSCTFSGNQAPTSIRQQPPSNKINSHVVVPGETLYTIAWRYGLDYTELARANGIDKNFLIYPGQTLQLRYKPQVNPQVASAPVSRSIPPPKKPVIREQKPTSKVVAKPSPAVKKPAPITTLKKPRSEKKSSPRKATVVKNKTIVRRWPTSGKVLTNFSTVNKANKGIDIAGKKGDSVLAAASGEIVYAGSGLRGYGKLVIIKHSKTYLSAYAHNSKILVREGQIVKVGQHIADVGSSGSRTNTAKLHFEIRYNGKPVDPLKLLPRKKT